MAEKAAAAMGVNRNGRKHFRRYSYLVGAEVPGPGVKLRLLGRTQAGQKSRAKEKGAAMGQVR